MPTPISATTCGCRPTTTIATGRVCLACQHTQCCTFALRFAHRLVPIWVALLAPVVCLTPTKRGKVEKKKGGRLRCCRQVRINSTDGGKAYIRQHLATRITHTTAGVKQQHLLWLNKREKDENKSLKPLENRTFVTLLLTVRCSSTHACTRRTA